MASLSAHRSAPNLCMRGSRVKDDGYLMRRSRWVCGCEWLGGWVGGWVGVGGWLGGWVGAAEALRVPLPPRRAWHSSLPSPCRGPRARWTCGPAIRRPWETSRGGQPLSGHPVVGAAMEPPLGPGWNLVPSAPLFLRGGRLRAGSGPSRLAPNDTWRRRHHLTSRSQP